MGTETTYFHARFKKVPRTAREQILCSMIRINYGTPWDGDRERLEGFFPEGYHRQLVFGGLTDLIERLSPFADEPTDYGVNADGKAEETGEITERHFLEITESIDGVTADLPLPLRP